MLTNLVTKTLLDRWRGVAVTTASTALMLLFAMAVYRDIDLGVYAQMPEAMRSVVGISAEADVASLAYGVIFSSYGALAYGGISIAMGAAAIAGEEGAGTIGVLLGNPVSRTRVLLSKAAALSVLILLASLVLWGAAVGSPVLLDVNVTGMDVTAFTVHFTLSALLYGLLALAVGAWTGRRGAASGTATAVMVVSFFAVGLLPLVEGWADLARAFPWYYLAAGDPLLNGVQWRDVAVLAGSCALLVPIAVVGLRRRDLRSASVGVTLLDTLRAAPLTRRIADRLAGSARVSRIWVKTASEHQGVLIIVAATMFWLMGVAMGPIYTGLSDTLLTFGSELPETMLALFGGGDLSTPEGFYQIETFGMMAPAAVLVVTIAVGARALAGEEQERTIALLLANPVSRTRVLAEKALTMVLFGAAVGAATFAGVAAGAALAGLGTDVGNIAATSLLATLVGLVFGALSLLLSAATGLVRVAIFVPVGAALAFHVMDALAELDGAGWGRLSPFHYYLGGDPLVAGLDWAHAALLAALTAGILALAFPAYRRRDLRQTS